MAKRLIVENGIARTEISGWGGLLLFLIFLGGFALMGVAVFFAFILFACWKISPVIGVVATVVALFLLKLKGFVLLLIVGGMILLFLGKGEKEG